jgi:hypothetical protein
MTDQFYMILGSFLLVEACVGIFFAASGTLRSMIVPESSMAAVSNVFRVPLNILVVIGTKLDSYYAPSTVFSFVFVWFLVAGILQFSLAGAMAAKSDNKKE